MKTSDIITIEEKKTITEAIKNAELNTSGEIRVHIESKCKDDVLDRASYIFDKLNMQKTDLRNGVLFYLAINDKKFAILGDAGINAVTPDNFWDEIKDNILKNFKESEFAKGLSTGIVMAGEALKKHFPYQKDDINELSDEISFGDK
ncbi:MAG: TPM domain-containing protein [Bacteroidota bacterium]|nr:TPM domain-containing protein [Bacteroidota bacterium]